MRESFDISHLRNALDLTNTDIALILFMCRESVSRAMRPSDPRPITNRASVFMAKKLSHVVERVRLGQISEHDAKALSHSLRQSVKEKNVDEVIKILNFYSSNE